MRARYGEIKHPTAWYDIGDMAIPGIYLRKYMAMLNQLQNGQCHLEEKAFEQYKQILIILSQVVFRHQSKKEEERISDLDDFPDGI